MYSAEKTIIGVLTTHDDPEITRGLVDLLDEFCTTDNAKVIRHFHFVFTGGTFKRVVEDGETDRNGNRIVNPVNKHTREILLDKCGVTCLPGYRDGGVTILSYLITQRLCSILWSLFTAKEYHWRRPENLAQFRLCDQWHVKRLMNVGSVRRWFFNEAERDIARNRRPCPPEFLLRAGAKTGQVSYSCGDTAFKDTKHRYYEIKRITPLNAATSYVDNIVEHVNESQQPGSFPTCFKDMTIALIAHDDMKERMVSFAIDHEWELRKFGSILATGTTGREVGAATSKVLDDLIHRYHSGPKGGDVEIATEILLGRCHVVIFFVDPLHPHPHIDDIRAVFEACMARQGVVMITNEMHAREFMSNVVRVKDEFNEPVKVGC